METYLNDLQIYTNMATQIVIDEQSIKSQQEQLKKVISLSFIMKDLISIYHVQKYSLILSKVKQIKLYLFIF